MQLLKFFYGPQELGQTFFRYLPPLLNSPKKVKLKKVINALRGEYERRIKRIKIKSYPFILHIEPTNACNIRCPNCITGAGENNQEKGMMQFETFKKIVDDLKEHLVIIRLDGLGESLLHKDFFKMLKYASQNNIITSLSTNFTAITPDNISAFIDAGLDYIIVGLDASTEETYQKVRTGGNLELVIKNLKKLIELKKERKSKTPFIETQFITFNDNAHEVEQTRELSIQMGVDRHLIKDLRQFYEKLIKEESEIPRKEKKLKSCYWLYYVLNVNWKGDLKTCCLDGLDSKFSFGNINVNNAVEEWNNSSMQNIRKLFIKKNSDLMKELAGCACLRCYKFR